MLCFDEPAKVKGDYQSNNVSNLQILLVKCDNNVREGLAEGQTCKSDYEIEQWMRRKFIVTLTNGQDFENDNYS